MIYSFQSASRMLVAGCWVLLLLLLRQRTCTTTSFELVGGAKFKSTSRSRSSAFASSPRQQGKGILESSKLDSNSIDADLGSTGSTAETATTISMASTSTVNEGSLIDMWVASTMAQQPGSTAAFYNPKRRVGRDCSVLSVAQWLLQRTNKQQQQQQQRPVPVNVLDAHAASGITGLRVAIESPILAAAAYQHDEDSLLLERNQENNSNTTSTRNNWNNLDDNDNEDDDNDENFSKLRSSVPPLHVVLNDVDPAAVQVAVHNTNTHVAKAALPSTSIISVSNRNSQSLWHETSFDISLVDPFGCTTACLDAALAQAPQGGLIDVCATDVTALYGGRPAIVSRHYNGAHLTTHPHRPPCFKERGVRLLLAAVAQAAGRHDRGIKPLYSLSTAHYVVVAIHVVRRGEAKTFGPDAAMRHVQRVSICRSCGAAGGRSDDDDDIASSATASTTPDCSCDEKLNPGSGTSASPEGPLWLGPLHDPTHLQEMIRLAGLPQARHWITPETQRVLQTMYEESLVESPSSSRNYTLFHRRPSLAAPGQMPRLDHLIDELQQRGYKACRTQFDSQALKSNASPSAFDDAVRAIL
jgi:tRNA G26 N,N-dimethylase Trm1